MNPERLLQNFDRLIDTPDAVPRLRRFILDLAVRGKLVEQNPEDEPAAELLKRIEAEKTRLINEGVINRDKSFSKVTIDEAPFKRPSNWQWVRIGECLELINGRAFKPTDWQETGLPIVRIQNLNSINAPFNFCDDRLVEERHRINSGSFLISWSGTPGTSFGAFIWERGSAALNQHIFKCFQPGNSFFDKFLRLAINGRLDEMIAKAHGGVGLQHITKGKLENLVLPLPPLAEQHRIVAKVDELMKLCDELEAAQAKRERRRDRLVAATLHGLNNGKTDGENGESFSFEDSARFYFNHLPRLTTRLEHINQLRQTILNLAVRGKLVLQDPKDEPAAELLKRIAAKKERLVKEGKIKKQEPLPLIPADDIPFEVPLNWKWLRLCGVGVLSGGMTPSKNRTDYWGGNINWFSPKDIKSDEIIESGLKITAMGLKEAGLQLYPPGCLFMVARSGILKRTFPVSINRIEATANQDLKILRPFISGLERYLQIMFWGMTYFILSNLIKTGTTVQSLKYEEFELQPIPLPPLAEQHRIVAKVDELMALCDEMETRITTNTATSGKLLEATMQEALSGCIQVA